MLSAGLRSVDITPPIGTPLAGFYSRIQPSTDVLDPLLASVLVLQSGGSQVVLVACDILSLKGHLATQVRQAVAEAVGVDVSRVLVNCSHTHSGPLLGIGADDPKGLAVEQAPYFEQLKAKLAGAARAAAASLAPARIAVGHIESRAGVNRRTDTDGRVVIGINPSGPHDPRLKVLRIEGDDGPVAVLASYACHPIVLGPKSRAISADFVGPMRQVVEQGAGAPFIFLQGAAGDQGPAIGVDAPAWRRESMGRQLGHQVLTVFEELGSAYYATRSEVFESVAPLTNVHLTRLPDDPVVVDALETEVRLPLQAAPEREQFEAHLRAAQQAVQELSAAGAPLWQVQVQEVQATWAAKMLRLLESGPLQREVAAQLQAVRVGDIALVSLPVEPFIRTALEIEAASPAKHTLVLGYTNGCEGYVPTPDEYARGGYEVENSYKLYGLPAPFAVGADGVLRDESVALVKRLFA